MKRTMSAIAAATLTLTLAACSDESGGTDSAGTTEQEGYLATDLSGIEKVDEIAAMVPEAVAEMASSPWAPTSSLLPQSSTLPTA